MKLLFIITKQVLLITFLLLLTCNLSNSISLSSAQEPQVFGGQQLILRPIGTGSNNELFDVEDFSGPFFSENWRYAELVDSKILRVHWQDGSATDTYKMSNHDPIKNFGSIYSIEIIITYSSTGQQQGIAGAVYINGSIYAAEKYIIKKQTERSVYSGKITNNPATSEPWTWEDIDNLEAGATLFVGSLSFGPDFDQVYVIVNYGLNLTVITNPLDCNVTMNGVTINSASNGSKFTGLTPFSICNITVSKRYFYPKTETISINNTNVQRTISLSPSHYQLVVATNPENCKVFIDGIEQSSGWFPENTQHNISVSKDSYYTKEEIVTVETQDLTVQITLVSLLPIPTSYITYILFCVIGFIIILSIFIVLKNRKKIASWDRERKEFTLIILMIAIGAALTFTLFFFGDIIGLTLALLNVGGVSFVLYSYLYIDEFEKLGIIALFCLGVIVILYILAGSFWGPITLMIIDIVVFAIAVLSSAASSDASRVEIISSDSQNTQNYSSGPEIESRTCVICGRPLRSRRKYCSYCRPWGTRTPTDEEEEIISPVWQHRRRTADELIGKRRSADELIGKSRAKDLEYFGEPKSYEDLVGKRKKRRYF